MRICIPAIDPEEGGSGTFRQQFRIWLTEKGIPWTDNPDDADYDILFANAWQIPYRVVYQHKVRLPNVRVVQRVDGAGRDYGRTDSADVIQHAVNTLADVTIFQSDYSRHSTMQKYKIITLDGPTIYNPVDTDFFHPDDDKKRSSSGEMRVISAIWSPNPRKGAWRIPNIAEANPDIEFIFIGEAEFEEVPPNLSIFGRMSREELAGALRSADLFLNLSENDPCPNVVLEALASGLPVLYVPSGGTPELVGKDAGLPFTNDGLFRMQLERIRAHLRDYQAAARERAAQNFARDIIFKQYLDTIASAPRRPLPSVFQHWFSRAQMARVWLSDKVVNYTDWMP